MDNKARHIWTFGTHRMLLPTLWLRHWYIVCETLPEFCWFFVCFVGSFNHDVLVSVFFVYDLSSLQRFGSRSHVSIILWKKKPKKQIMMLFILPQSSRRCDDAIRCCWFWYWWWCFGGGGGGGGCSCYFDCHCKSGSEKHKIKCYAIAYTPTAILQRIILRCSLLLPMGKTMNFSPKIFSSVLNFIFIFFIAFGV